MSEAKERRIYFQDNHFILEFPFNQSIVDFIKLTLPGKRWNKKADPPHWTAPVTFEVAQKLYGLIEKFKFLVSSEATEALRELSELASQNLTESAQAEAELEIPGFGKELHPFQRAGVRYARRVKRTFIADDMRLGKTLQALATIELEKAYPAVIVCPATVKINWSREIKACLPGRSYVLIKNVSDSWYRGADFTIINYDIVGKLIEPLRALKPQAVIFDESHYCKGGNTLRTKACKKLTEDKPPFVLNLTGTPMLNRPAELIAQLALIDRLNDLGGWLFFTHRYCKATKTRFGLDVSGASNLAELATRLRSCCMIRRTKEEVLNYIPKTIPVFIPLTNEVEYRKAEANLIDWLLETEGEESAGSARRAEQLVRIEKLKQLSARGKMQGIKDWIENFLEVEDKLIVFAHHKEIQEALILAFPGCAKYLSKDDMPDADRFQTDARCKLIICSLSVIGISLAAASNGAFFEFGWNPASLDQPRDRMALISKKETVTAWHMIAEGTIDEDILELIDEKRAVISGAVGGGDVSILTELISRMRGKKKR